MFEKKTPAPIRPTFPKTKKQGNAGHPAIRPCGRDLVEFFTSTGWAFYDQLSRTLEAFAEGSVPQWIRYIDAIAIDERSSRLVAKRTRTAGLEHHHSAPD